MQLYTIYKDNKTFAVHFSSNSKATLFLSSAIVDIFHAFINEIKEGEEQKMCDTKREQIISGVNKMETILHLSRCNDVGWAKWKYFIHFER